MKEGGGEKGRGSERDEKREGRKNGKATEKLFWLSGQEEREKERD